MKKEGLPSQTACIQTFILDEIAVSSCPEHVASNHRHRHCPVEVTFEVKGNHFFSLVYQRNTNHSTNDSIPNFWEYLAANIFTT